MQAVTGGRLSPTWGYMGKFPRPVIRKGNSTADFSRSTKEGKYGEKGVCLPHLHDGIKVSFSGCHCMYLYILITPAIRRLPKCRKCHLLRRNSLINIPLSDKSLFLGFSILSLLHSLIICMQFIDPYLLLNTRHFLSTCKLPYSRVLAIGDSQN
jgi:hypothetical protein